VPLIVRWSGVIAPGSVSDEPVIGTDFYPTFVEAAWVDLPADHPLDGGSLMPLFRNADAGRDRGALCCHFPGYPNSEWRASPVSVTQSGRWKLMKFYDMKSICDRYDFPA